VLRKQTEASRSGHDLALVEHGPDILADIDEGERPRAEEIARHVRGILKALDLDLHDPNLAETDLRVAKMYL
jgi:GTP cyclohydrolase I